MEVQSHMTFLVLANEIALFQCSIAALKKIYDIVSWMSRIKKILLLVLKSKVTKWLDFQYLAICNNEN